MKSSNFPLQVENQVSQQNSTACRVKSHTSAYMRTTDRRRFFDVVSHNTPRSVSLLAQRLDPSLVCVDWYVVWVGVLQSQYS